MLGMLFWTAVGIALGWFVLPQPAWASDLWNKAVSTVKGWVA